MAQPVHLTLVDVRCAVAALLEEDPGDLDDHEDLIRRGLDSVRVMKLASVFQQAGVSVKFAELLERPRLADWWELAEAARYRTPEASLQERPRLDPRAPFELSPMQQAYWVGRSSGQVLNVGCHFYFEFDGNDVDARRLEVALRNLMHRHGMLRARFSDDGLQTIEPESPWPGVEIRDLRELPSEAVDAELERVRAELAHRRLDVSEGEVFDVQLTLLGDRKTRVHMNIDMLVADAMSFRIMLDELARLYADPDAHLSSIDYSFPEYLAERVRRGAFAHARARRYWLERLDELPGPPQLPQVMAPEEVREPRLGRRSHWLLPEQRARLTRQAHQHGLTLPMVLVTAFAETIGLWSTEKRFVLNLPLFDREGLDPDVPKLVGDFTNLLLLSVDVSQSGSIAEHARRIQAQFIEDVRHAEFSGVEVLRELVRAHPDRAVSAPVVFTSAIGMGELFDSARRSFGELAWMSSQTAQVWLDHQVLEHASGLLLNWDVCEPLFPRGMIDAMFDAYVRLVEWLSDDGSAWHEPPPSMLPASQVAVRERVNRTEGPESGRRLHDRFFDQAARAPERVALVESDGSEVSYRELAERTLEVAGYLVERGTRQGEPVVVQLPKGSDQVAAVLGVLAAGAAYVPVGIDQPPERRHRIVADVGAKIVLDDLAPARGARSLESPVPGTAEGLAYVIYTSGSTGEPKGVEITHRSAVNTIEDVNATFGVGCDDRVLAVSALDFDLSVYDIFGLLSVGGAVVLIDESERRDAWRWAEIVRDRGVTVWNAVPALLDMLLLAGSDRGLGRGLRLALASGDWVGVDLAARLARQCPGARLVALGGATEAAIWSNAWEVKGAQPLSSSVPYGFPLRNQRFRIVDARERDCPDWVAGELWIGGAGVALGYRGDPERTAQHFVVRAGERWYRTGDAGRYWPDGMIEFLGRSDARVKIRGHRIELGEIEAALESHPRVARAVALVAGEPRERLVAYVVLEDHELDPDSLRAYLAARLPAYALPTRIETLDRLPLTPNGKIDRKELAARLPVETIVQPHEAPKGPVEIEIAALWSEVLGIDSVRRAHGFLEAGGDSLLATRLIRLLRQRLRVDVSLREFLDAQTVARLAEIVTSRISTRSQACEEGVI